MKKRLNEVQAQLNQEQRARDEVGNHLRPDLLKPLLDRKIDLLAPCINGGFGNMGHIDAARLVQATKPRYAVPCHFWTFAEQGAGDPWGFIQACRFLCPDVSALLLKPGEPFLLEAQ